MMNKKEIIAILKKMETLNKKSLLLKQQMENAGRMKTKDAEYIMLKVGTHGKTRVK